jgi:hypothetical protein
MKRGLVTAATLGVVLFIAVAVALEWPWDCPLCGGLEDRGIAYYTCPSHNVFVDSVADYTDDYVGPPDRICPVLGCSQSCDADSAVCNSEPTHRWYAPYWEGYRGGD